MAYEWSFGVVWAYRHLLLQGIIVTIELTIISIILGTILAVALAMARLSKKKAVCGAAGMIIEILRAIPILILLIWFFYAFPLLTGISLPPFETSVVALSLSLAAFSAETIRAGIKAVPSGQIDAARAVGMSYIQTFRRIVFPQAFQKILPPLLNDYIGLLKLSALASIIGVTELLHEGNNIIVTTYRPLEVYTAVAVLYLIIILPVTWFSKRLEGTAGV